MKSKILCQGAEAKIILSNGFIIKDRIPKSYRIKELDEQIRSRRSRAESKLLFKASQIITSPAPFFPLCIKGSTKIKMPFIDGKRLSEHLDNFTLDKQKKICKQIGENISKLHDEDIIHGDLTTSNMILVEHPTSTNHPSKKTSPLIKSSRRNLAKPVSEQLISEQSEPIIFFIDFGLGFISHKFEDKAVDLHLLKQALEAKHFKHWEVLFNEVVKRYKKTKDAKIVFERLKAVEKRGRYKHK